MIFTTLPDAILFDFDGVLASSHALHASAWHEAAREQGFEGSLTAMLHRYSGLAPRSIAAGLAGELGGDASRLYARKLAIMAKRAAEVPLLPGAKELLLWCREQKLPHGIASNSPASLVQSILQSHALFDEDMILIGEQEGYLPKPDPAPYLRLFAALGLEHPRHEAWIIEDSLPGIQAAVASKLGPAIGIAREDIPRTRIMEQGASHLFDSPRQLLDTLLKLLD